MSLHYGSLYWPGTYQNPPRYEPLRGNRTTRVVVVGGGMSGATCGYALAAAGIETTLIERGRIAGGSSSSNTGLLQYANDTMLSDFAKTIGETRAVRFYRACKEAAERLHAIADRLPRDVQFKRRSSLYYASAPDDVPAMRAEHEMLVRHGFSADWLEEADIADAYPFRRSAAIVTRGDGELNPFRFVHALVEEGTKLGLSVHEHTMLQDVERSPSGRRYVVRTADGSIEADHIVYAVGYLPEQAGGRWIQARLNRSYAIVTNVLTGLADWHDRALLWESARPYLYARTTPDDRIVVGGLDEGVRQPVLSAAELRAHSLRLLAELKRLFPRLEPDIRYEWCATFGESVDGLPWIGEDPDRPGQFYLLGYGGNGTIYSMLGADLIKDKLLGIDNPIADIVRPDRPVIPPAPNA